MIDLYTWKTSNGRKVTVMAEELGIDYGLHLIDISKDQQFTPEYIAINPNSKIPALIDSDGPDGKPFTLFESGAMLIYMAEKFGKLLPTAPVKRYETLQWLMFQMGGVGPQFGQAHHFRRAAKGPEEAIQYGIERYTRETRRLWGVLDTRLADNEFIAAGEYTIVDIAVLPWTARYDWQGIALEEFPNVKRWFEALMARPAVVRGMETVYDEKQAAS